MKRIRIAAALALVLFPHCMFNGLSSDSRSQSYSDSTTNHGKMQRVHWTAIKTWTITKNEGTSAYFSDFRQFKDDRLLVHEFYYYPQYYNGIEYIRMFEDSNWYDDQGRLIFSKEYYNPSTLLRRPMAVRYIFRTGSKVDSILDTLYETEEKRNVINVIKRRVAHSSDGKAESTFVKSSASSEFLSSIFERDSSQNMIKKMYVIFNARVSASNRVDTEYTTIKYRGKIFEMEDYRLIFNQSKSINDSISYLYRTDGRLDSVYIFKSGILHSGGNVDYRIILDMNKEIQDMYNFATVYKTTAQMEKMDNFIPPPFYGKW